MVSTFHLGRIDFRSLIAVFLLLGAGLVGIASQTSYGMDFLWSSSSFQAQMKFIFLGFTGYFGMLFVDYRFWKKAAPFLYGVMIFFLIGLFFVPAIQHVHRWYRLPMGMTLQPSEFAKIVLIIFLAAWLDGKEEGKKSLGHFIQGLFFLGVPFLLIVKEPDLGTALVLWPIGLGIFYLGDLYPRGVKLIAWIGLGLLLFILSIFLEIIPFENVKAFITLFMKEYQCDRLSPYGYHQVAAQKAIALGGLLGEGIGNGHFAREGWLPFSYTDSIFPSLCEEVGLLGGVAILILFFSLIYFSFQVTALAKDHFGRLLACGVAVYLSVHVLINIGMMCGLLPITGVPLPLMTLGGSSMIATMMALGLVQSVYCQRFRF